MEDEASAPHQQPTISLFATENGIPQELLEILRHLPLDEKIVSRIDHSTKFADDVFEYRFVLLPRNHPLLELSTELRNRFLTEAEWRALGIRQTRGWEHFGYSPHETNILLFRRVIGTDPRSGRLSTNRQGHTAPVLQRLVELAESTQRYQFLHLNRRDDLRDGPSSFKIIPSQQSPVGSRCTTADSDNATNSGRRMLVERVSFLGSQQRIAGIEPCHGLSPATGEERDVPGALARLVAAALRVQPAHDIHPNEATVSPELDTKVLEVDWFAGPAERSYPLQVAKELDEARFVNDVDFLYAKRFLPFFTATITF